MVRGFQTNELERQAGLASGEASRLANGERKRPGVETLRKVARTLGVSFEWLAFGEGSGPNEAEATPTTSLNVVLEYDERYPERAYAAKAAELLGLAPEAIAQVCNDRLEFSEDPGRVYWFRQMERVHDQYRLLNKDPTLTQRETEHARSLMNNLKQRTKPKLPTQKRKAATK